MEGWVYKLGSTVKNWKKRWLLLDGLTMRYFVAKDGLCKRTIDASLMLAVQQAPECELQPSFKLVTPSRTFYFVTQTDDECDDWIALLKHVIDTDVCKVHIYCTNYGYVPHICNVLTDIANSDALVVDDKSVLMVFEDGIAPESGDPSHNVIIGYVKDDATVAEVKAMDKMITAAVNASPNVVISIICDLVKPDVRHQTMILASKFRANLAFTNLEDIREVLVAVEFIVRGTRLMKYMFMGLNIETRNVKFTEYKNPFVYYSLRRSKPNIKTDLEVNIYGLADKGIFDLKPMSLRYEASEIRLTKNIYGDILERILECDIPILCLADDDQKGIKGLRDLSEFMDSRKDKFFMVCYVHTGNPVVTPWQEVVKLCNELGCSAVEVCGVTKKNMKVLWRQCARRYFRRESRRVIPLRIENHKNAIDALSAAFTGLGGDLVFNRVSMDDVYFKSEEEQFKKSEYRIKFDDLVIGETIDETDDILIRKGRLMDKQKKDKKRNDDENPNNCVMMVNHKGRNMRYIFRDVNTLCHVRHPCLVKYMGWTFNRSLDDVDIVSEFLVGGPLDKAMDNKKLETMSQKIIVAIGISIGMQMLHSIWMTHRRLQPSNIYLDNRLEPKVAMFWWKNSDENLLSGPGGDPRYMAPELTTGRVNGHTFSSNVYAFAIILYELMIHKTTFLDSRDEIWRPSIPETVPGPLAALIRECWDHDPAKRPTFSQITNRLIDMALLLNARSGGDEKSLAKGKDDIENYISRTANQIRIRVPQSATFGLLRGLYWKA